MKITVLYPQCNAPAAKPGAKRPAAPEGDTPGPQARNVDRVELSDAAKEMQRVSTLTDCNPEIGSEKVETIKQQIQDGTYTIDSGKIARKMIQESLFFKF